MNNTSTVTVVPQSGTNNTIIQNVLAWQAAKREQARRVRVAREARQFRANFGSVRFALPKGFSLAA